MPPEGTDAGQQGTPPTGSTAAAGAQPPAQPTPPSPPPATPPVNPHMGNPPAAAPPPQQTEDWHARYNGLQQLHQKTAEELKAMKAQLQQYTQHAGTLEQQLNTAQDGHVQTAQQLQQSQAQLAAAQRENQFWNLVATEFPALMKAAPYIQRADDVEQQRQILASFAQVVGASVQQQTNAQLAQALAGVTPGTTPPVGGGAPTYDRGDIYEKIVSTRPGTPEHDEAMRIWAEITKDDPRKLHPEWQDPVKSDWETIEDAPEYLQPKVEPGAENPFIPS